MKRDYNSAGLGGPAIGMRSRLNDFSLGFHHQPHPHHLHQHPHHHHHHHHNQHHHHHNLAATKPGKQLMSFQAYVRTLSNNVDENTAYKKYKDFMANLSQSKVGRFFDTNKDREWFRLRYHPVDGHKAARQQYLNFQKRLKIFNNLNDKNYFDNIPFTNKSSSLIINLMDAIIVQLEDGPQELVEQLLAQNKSEDPQLREKFIPQKPTSVIIDDIDIDTTIGDIQGLCTKASPDLLRIAQLDPFYVEGGQLKRKVVAIFKDTADIRDVCWKLSKMRLNNKALNVYINKSLTKRIHITDAISNHHVCIVNDIRNAINLILNFDELKGLHGARQQNFTQSHDEPMDTSETIKPKEDPSEEACSDPADVMSPSSPRGSEKSVTGEDGEKPFDVSNLDEEKEKEQKKLYDFKFNINFSLHHTITCLNTSKNPVLRDALRYLVEFTESSAASYYLSKVSKELQLEPTDISFDGDDVDRYSTIDLIVKNLSCSVDDSVKFLDKMLWYLRIVHSFDYYTKALYRQEDELTLRMSLIHVRDDPDNMPQDVSESAIRLYLQKDQHALEEFGQSQAQKYVTKDEERFNYKSYGKVITDELASYSQRIQKPKTNETEEVYKCKHCTRVFQKLSDIGRHFVGKHRWAVDTIELETDFFNAYLFDASKINPCPPKELLEVPPNRFARLTNFSQMGEDPDLLQQTIEAYSKMESFVREPAPRAQVESDPRNDSIVDYTDISFDDAI